MIDVIVPINNEANSINSFIKSINFQKKHINQVIIINDDSDDGSPKIIFNNLINNNINVKLINNLKKIGPILSIKKGLDLVTAEFVAIASCNDITLDGMYAGALRDFEMHPEAGLWSAMVLDCKGRKVGISNIMLPSINKAYITKLDAYNNIYKYGTWFEGATLIFRVSKLVGKGEYFFNENLGAYSDTFTCIYISINHGAIFRPEIFAINNVNQNSYGMLYFNNKNNLKILENELSNLVNCENFDPILFNRLIKRLKYTFNKNINKTFTLNNFLMFLKYRYYDFLQIMYRYLFLMNLKKFMNKKKINV